MKKTFLLFFLLVVVTQAQKVACIGNSLTHSSYPIYLNEKTTATVKEFGVPGATMRKTHPNTYWNTGDFVEVKAWNPDYVIILLGTNDTSILNWAGTASTQFAADYREFLTYFTGKIYLGIIPYVMPEAIQIERNANIDEAIAIILCIASEKGLELINFKAALHPEHYQADNLHINLEGQQVMADVAWEALKNYLPAMVCIDTNWQPDPSTVLKNQTFTQTSNCGNTRNAVGTKPQVVYEDMVIAHIYDEITQSIQLFWLHVEGSTEYRLNKAWPKDGGGLHITWKNFYAHEQSYKDSEIMPNTEYYYSVEAFKDGYWQHKSPTIGVLTPVYLNIAEEYWQAVDDYEVQRNMGFFRGCSQRNPK